jgi:hypothetical protein
MKLIGAFSNPNTGEIRVAFKLKLGCHAVVKLFRTDEEAFSIKFWWGDFQKTMSYWNTVKPVKDQRIVEEARKRIIHFLQLVGKAG